MRTATINPALLVEPARLPAPQASPEGMTGKQALDSGLAVYDVGGQIRATLIELQREVRILLGMDQPAAAAAKR